MLNMIRFVEIDIAAHRLAIVIRRNLQGTAMQNASPDILN